MAITQETAKQLDWTVYVHTCRTNGKRYVGITSRQAGARWRANGTGYNTQPKFWNAIKKHGWNGFDHEIVASCPSPFDACSLERELIKKYDSHHNGYNSSDGGELFHGITHTPIVQFSLDGKRLSTFQSISEAARATGIAIADISRAAKWSVDDVHDGVSKSGGFQWRYYDDVGEADSIRRYKPYKTKNQRQVVQFDLDWNVIAIYESLADAGRALDVAAASVWKACSGKKKRICDSYWRYLDDCRDAIPR